MVTFAARAGEEAPSGPARQVAPPEIELAPEAVRPGAEIRGIARRLGPGRYTLEWRDRWGVLDRRDIDGPGDARFSFLVSCPRTAENELVLALAGGSVRKPDAAARVREEASLASRERDAIARSRLLVELPPAGRRGYIRVLVPDAGDPPRDFPAEAVLWRPGGRHPPAAFGGRELLVDIGLEALLAPSPRGRVPLVSDPAAQEPSARGCLGDAALREAARERIREVLSSREAARAAAISLGTGLDTACGGRAGEDCASPACVSAFGEYLRGKYGTLDALSAAWGLTLTDWEEAASATVADRFGRGDPASVAWSDRLSFREDCLASFLRFAAEETRKFAPHAPVGFLQTPGPGRYADPERLASIVDWRGGEWGPGERVLAASKAAPGTRLAGWAGSSPARALLAAFGGELVQLFRPSEAACAAACGGLAGGLGRLVELSSPPLARAARGANPGVALVYSAASMQASALVDAGAAPAATGEVRIGSSWWRVWEAWCALLGDLGVPFECLTEGDLARGDLVAGGFGAAILPRMLAVERSSARELARFVSSGGIVLADAGTGMFDGSLRRAQPGVLRELLGVEHASQPLLRFSEVGPRRVQIADRPFAFRAPIDGPSWFPRVLSPGPGPAESGLELVGARAEAGFGGLPCLAVNRFGGGWAVTLNLAMSAYLDLRPAGGGAALLELVRAALARAGVRKVVELRPPEGTPFPPVACLRELGGASIVAVAREGPPGARPGRLSAGGESCRARLRVDAPSSRAAYDSLAGSFIGWTNEIDVELAIGESRVYAFLPYRLVAILVEPAPAPELARPGVEGFELVLRREGGEGFVPHVLSVDVEGPDGRSREELRQLVEVSGGRARFVVPFAVSDPRGLWTLRVRDAATGLVSLRRIVR